MEGRVRPCAPARGPGRRILLLVASVATLLLALAPAGSSARQAANPLAGEQTYLGAIRVPALPSELEPVLVGVLDAGIDVEHPDLAGRIAATRSFVPARSTPQEAHGTATAGLIAAIPGNGIGIDGIAPNARLLFADVAGAARGLVRRGGRRARDPLGGGPRGARAQPLARRTPDPGIAGGRRPRRRARRARRRGCRQLLGRRRDPLRAVRAGDRGCVARVAAARARRRRDGRRLREPVARGLLRAEPALGRRRRARHADHDALADTEQPLLGRARAARIRERRRATGPAARRTAAGARPEPPTRPRWSRRRPPSSSAQRRSSSRSRCCACSRRRRGRWPATPCTRREPGCSTSPRRSTVSGAAGSPRADHAEPNELRPAPLPRSGRLNATVDWYDDPADDYVVPVGAGRLLTVRTSGTVDARVRVELGGTTVAAGAIGGTLRVRGPALRPGHDHDRAGRRRPAARTPSRSAALLEPVVRVRLVVERGDLLVAGAPVERDRLAGRGWSPGGTVRRSRACGSSSRSSRRPSPSPRAAARPTCA